MGTRLREPAVVETPSLASCSLPVDANKAVWHRRFILHTWRVLYNDVMEAFSPVGICSMLDCVTFSNRSARNINIFIDRFAILSQAA